MSITPRENLLRVLRHERPEWIPICGHCDPYNQPNRRGMDPDLAARLGDVRWGDESSVHFARALGIDIADWQSAPVRVRQRTLSVESRNGDSERVTLWHTPCGDLREVRRYSPDTRMWYIAEHAVKTPEDLPRLAAVFEDMEHTLPAEGIEAVRRRRALIGDDGILMCPIPGTPLGQMVRAHAGVETLAYLWADAPDALRDLFGVIEAAHARHLALALQCENDVIITVDDTSTTTISPAMFETFCLGYTDRFAAAVHKAGRWYFHHSCGLIRDLLPLYRRTQMDAVHAFTIPPIGNVTVAQGRELLGDRIIIYAGLSQLFGSLADRAAVTRSIEAMVRGAGDGDHFILGLAADPEKTMDDTRLIVDICRRLQRQPPR